MLEQRFVDAANDTRSPNKRSPNKPEQEVANKRSSMALDPQTQAALALHRFGFGPRADSIAKFASDPRGALLAELDRPGAGLIADPNLLTSAEAAQAQRDFRQVRKV